jgi:hypothetical protein
MEAYEWSDGYGTYRVRILPDVAMTGDMMEIFVPGAGWKRYKGPGIVREFLRLAEENERLLEERARVRRELLEAIEEASFVVNQYVYLQGTWTPTGQSTRQVIDEEDIRAALDRICPAQEITSPSTTSP